MSITSSRSLLKLMSIESEIPSNHLILCGPLLLLPSIFPSIRVFSRVNSSLIVLAFALWIPYRKQFRMSWWIQQIIKSHWSCEKSHFTLLKIVCFHREQVIFQPLKVHASICQSEDDNSVMGIFQTTVGLTKCTKQQPEWAFQNRPPLTLK